MKTILYIALELHATMCTAFGLIIIYIQLNTTHFVSFVFDLVLIMAVQVYNDSSFPRHFAIRVYTYAHLYMYIYTHLYNVSLASAVSVNSALLFIVSTLLALFLAAKLVDSSDTEQYIHAMETASPWPSKHACNIHMCMRVYIVWLHSYTPVWFTNTSPFKSVLVSWI